jgi:hypothetical protein
MDRARHFLQWRPTAVWMRNGRARGALFQIVIVVVPARIQRGLTIAPGPRGALAMPKGYRLVA